MPTPYELDVGLRWSDQDRQGHVNNAKIVTLAEEARIRFVGHLERGSSEPGQPGRAASEWDHVNFVVVHQEIDYHAETHYEPSIVLQVGVVRIGTKSFTLRQRGIQGGRPVFTVDTVMVLINVGENGSRPLLESERAQLEAWAWLEDPSTA